MSPVEIKALARLIHDDVVEGSDVVTSRMADVHALSGEEYRLLKEEVGALFLRDQGIPFATCTRPACENPAARVLSDDACEALCLPAGSVVCEPCFRGDAWKDRGHE